MLFPDLVDPDYQRRLDLSIAARDADVEKVRALLASGQRPNQGAKLPSHMTDSPLMLALANVPYDSQGQQNRHEVIGLLVDAFLRDPSLARPSQAFSEAFNKGDAISAARLLDFYEPAERAALINGLPLAAIGKIRKDRGQASYLSLDGVALLKWSFELGASVQGVEGQKSPLEEAITGTDDSYAGVRKQMKDAADVLREAGAVLPFNQSNPKSTAFIVEKVLKVWDEPTAGELIRKSAFGPQQRDLLLEHLKPEASSLFRRIQYDQGFPAAAPSRTGPRF